MTATVMSAVPSTPATDMNYDPYSRHACEAISTTTGQPCRRIARVQYVWKDRAHYLCGTHGHPLAPQSDTTTMRELAPISASEMCICIDADCPNWGWPERITPLPGAGAGEIFGCRKCDYISRERAR